jgi:HAMP domain-containing protein
MNNNAIAGMSIRTKIIIALVGLSLVSLVAVSLIFGFQIHKELKAQATQQLAATVRQKSVEYNLTFDRLAEEADAVAIFAAWQLQQNEVLTRLSDGVLMPWVNEGTGTGFNKGYGSPELESKFENEIPKIQRIGKMLIGIASKNQLIDSAYFSTSDGIFIGDTNEQVLSLAKREGYTPSKRGWYKLAVAEGKVVWSEPYVGASLGRLMVTVAAPVYSDTKTLLGVVGFDVLLKSIKEDVLAIDTGFGGYSLLVNNDGTALATPDIEKGEKRWDAQYKTDDLLKTDNEDWNTIVSEMVQGNNGIGEYNEEGIRYLAYAPVTALNASLGLVVSEDRVVAPAYNILKWIAAVAALISLFALLVGVFLGNSISRPMLELTRLVNEASIGKSELEPIENTRSDELGLLADAFNRLTKSLKISLHMNKQKDD